MRAVVISILMTLLRNETCVNSCDQNLDQFNSLPLPFPFIASLSWSHSYGEVFGALVVPDTAFVGLRGGRLVAPAGRRNSVRS